jgi:hypothetical protein
MDLTSVTRTQVASKFILPPIQLLFANINIFIIKIYLDISILAKNIMD